MYPRRVAGMLVIMLLAAFIPAGFAIADLAEDHAAGSDGHGNEGGDGHDGGHGTGEVDELAAPEFRMGLFWDYDFEFELDPLELSGTLRAEVAGMERIKAHGGNHEDGGDVWVITQTANGTFDTDINGTGLSGTWRMDGNIYAKTATLYPEKTEVTITTRGRVASGEETVGFINVLENVTEYQYIWDDLHYPLEVGDSGHVKADATFHSRLHTVTDEQENTLYSNGTFGLSSEFHVLGKEEVHTHGGNFTAFLVNITQHDGGYAWNWYAPDVGMEVKSRLFGSEGDLISSTEMRSHGIEPKPYAYMFDVPSAYVLMLVIGVLVIVPFLYAYTLGPPRDAGKE